VSDQVLVAYATKYGSTQEVAEAVAAVLRERGLAADVRPAGKVQSVADYSAVVLGAPLYIGSLLKDATRFLEKNARALSGKPLAVFALGPTIGKDEAEWQACRDQLDKALAKVPGLAPAAVTLFGGKYERARLRFPDTLLAAVPASPLYTAPDRDLRDWTAIKAWAGQVAEAIGGK
jgi:menaquinone-dependent protoporphyrinogen oxidase